MAVFVLLVLALAFFNFRKATLQKMYFSRLKQIIVKYEVRHVQEPGIVKDETNLVKAMQKRDDGDDQAVEEETASSDSPQTEEDSNSLSQISLVDEVNILILGVAALITIALTLIAYGSFRYGQYKTRMNEIKAIENENRKAFRRLENEIVMHETNERVYKEACKAHVKREIVRLKAVAKRERKKNRHAYKKELAVRLAAQKNTFPKLNKGCIDNEDVIRAADQLNSDLDLYETYQQLHKGGKSDLLKSQPAFPACMESSSASSLSK